jgi:hypothetical protein
LSCRCSGCVGCRCVDLGEGGLDTGADVVILLPLVGGLFTAAGVQDLLLGGGKKGKTAAPFAVGGGVGARAPDEAACAVGRGEVDAGEFGTAVLALGGPAEAGLVLGARHSLGVPVDAERGLRETFALMGIQSDRSEQIDPVFVTGGQDMSGGDVAAVDHVLVGQDPPGGRRRRSLPGGRSLPSRQRTS